MHFSTVSPKKTSDCLPDNTHFSYSCKFFSVGGINQNTFAPEKLIKHFFKFVEETSNKEIRIYWKSNPIIIKIRSKLKCAYLLKCGTRQRYLQNRCGNLCSSLLQTSGSTSALWDTSYRPGHWLTQSGNTK